MPRLSHFVSALFQESFPWYSLHSSFFSAENRDELKNKNIRQIMISLIALKSILKNTTLKFTPWSIT
ncbi:MAG: hypothetical protein IPL26_16625 [Leptospiraceae bacterium]|nr:hypothetical protein [Leptospiraceae bacterium]